MEAAYLFASCDSNPSPSSKSLSRSTPTKPQLLSPFKQVAKAAKAKAKATTTASQPSGTSSTKQQVGDKSQTALNAVQSIRRKRTLQNKICEDSLQDTNSSSNATAAAATTTSLSSSCSTKSVSSPTTITASNTRPRRRSSLPTPSTNSNRNSSNNNNSNKSLRAHFHQMNSTSSTSSKRHSQRGGGHYSHHSTDDDDVSEVTCDTMLRDTSIRSLHQQQYNNNNAYKANTATAAAGSDNHHHNHAMIQEMTLLKLELANCKAECDRAQWRHLQLLEKKQQADRKIAVLEKENRELKMSLRDVEKKYLVVRMGQTTSTATMPTNASASLGDAAAAADSISDSYSVQSNVSSSHMSTAYRTIHEDDGEGDEDDPTTDDNDDDYDDDDFDNHSVSMGWKNRNTTRLPTRRQQQQQHRRGSVDAHKSHNRQDANATSTSPHKVISSITGTTASSTPVVDISSLKHFQSGHNNTNNNNHHHHDSNCKNSGKNTAAMMKPPCARPTTTTGNGDEFQDLNLDDDGDDPSGNMTQVTGTSTTCYPEDDPFATMHNQYHADDDDDDANNSKTTSSSWWGWGKKQ